MAKYEGGCACGAVRYATEAEPIVIGHCQCRHCQQLSGTGHTSFAVFPVAAVTRKGEIKYWDYVADSGNTSSRGHCPTCGSMVFGKNSSRIESLGILLTSLDDPSKVSPQMVLFHGKALPWDYLDPNLPKFPGMPPM